MDAHRITTSTRFLAVVAAAALYSFGCGDGATDPPEGGPAEVAAIEVLPGADTLTALGDTATFRAIAFGESGDTIPDVTFSWSTSDGAVASVDGRGTVEALANGVADITATADGVTGASTLAVTQQVSTVAVEPTSATLTTVGATQAFTAAATDANGNVVQDARFVWASEDHTVATIDPDGLATAKGSGAIAITATAQDIPGHATLTVDQRIDHLAFLSEPSTATAGVAFDPAIQVEVRDADGQRVADAGIAITLGIGTDAGGGTLAGTKTVNAIDGIASFSGLWIDRTGTGYTLAATSTGVSAASSAPFDITPAAPVAIAYQTPPADSTRAGESLGVRVAIVDEFGNTVPSATDSVTLRLTANPDWGELVGASTGQTVDGVAAFDSLWIERAGPGYILEAAGVEFGAIASPAFRVVASAADHLGLPSIYRPQAPPKTSLYYLHVAVRDSFGNVVDTSAVDVSVAVGGGYPGANVSGDFVEPTDSGVAYFDSVFIDKPGTYDVTATSGAAADTTFAAAVFMFPDSRVVGAGGNHTCVGLSMGPFCWGANGSGQLGGPTASPLGDSVAVPAESDLPFDFVWPGGSHTCGLSDQQPYCWGANGSGQLGDGGGGVDQPAPVAVSGGTTFTWMATGASHTCAIGTDGFAYCWGLNDQGQLGTGSTGQGSDVPVLVTDTLTFIGIFAGDGHTCGWAQDSTAYCWGDNADGQLGDGNLGVDSPSPVAVAGADRFAWLTVGARHSCGITDIHQVLCWGANDAGQLNGGSVDSDTTVFVTTGGTTGITPRYAGQLAAGDSHTCLIKGVESGLYCWGSNDRGQLGTDLTTGTLGPTLIANTDQLEWVWIDAGNAHTCAYADDEYPPIEPQIIGSLGEGLSCWGANGNGQLGDGSTADASYPSRVVQGF